MRRRGNGGMETVRFFFVWGESDCDDACVVLMGNEMVWAEREVHWRELNGRERTLDEECAVASESRAVDLAHKESATEDLLAF